MVVVAAKDRLKSGPTLVQVGQCKHRINSSNSDKNDTQAGCLSGSPEPGPVLFSDRHLDLFNISFLSQFPCSETCGSGSLR